MPFPTLRSLTTATAACLILSAIPGAPALAQDAAAPAQTAAADPVDDSGKISLEMNNATDTPEGACRMTFVAANRSGTGFARTGWQVGIFDAAGIVRSILVLEFGDLADGKTKIVLFDLPGRPCSDISRVIVNDVAFCQPEGGAETEVASQCLDVLATRTRGDIEFGL